jgi:hypothetical protein
MRIVRTPGADAAGLVEQRGLADARLAPQDAHTAAPRPGRGDHLRQDLLNV